jgi:hypothetical protein
MGCDIHAYTEWQGGDGKWHKVGDAFPLDDFDKEWSGKDFGDSPFNWRSYGLFGFLAGVRNYSRAPVIAEPRGLPTDMSVEIRAIWDEDWDLDGHTPSWLSRAELLAFDYDQTFEDRRVTRGNNGAALADVGEGEQTTFREFLGAGYFRDLEVLRQVEAPEVRIVFWFDS